MRFTRPAADPASEPVLDDKAPLLTVERDGITYQVALDSWGGVLHTEAGEEVTLRSVASVADRTGLGKATITAWLEAGTLDGVNVLGVWFAVPDAYGRYHVRNPE